MTDSIETSEHEAEAWVPAQTTAIAGPPEVEAVIACLGDDAAQLRAENPEDERAANMEVAADLLASQAAELNRLNALINNPVIDDFLRGVQFESAHQVERFGAAHDAGKAPRDFFWLIAHLATRAMDHHSEAKRLTTQGGDLGGEILMDKQADYHREKALHHCVTTAAAMFHWWAQIRGVPTAFRPGLGEEQAHG